MTDVDDILRAHAAAAEAVELDPAAWDRLVAALDDPDAAAPGAPGGRPRSWRVALPVAAALLVVLGAVAVLALGDDDGTVRTDATSTPTSPVDTTASTATPSTAPVPLDVGPHPTRAVALSDVDGDGLADLVSLDGLGPVVDGRAAAPEVTVLQPSTSGGEVAAGDQGFSSVDVGPDGTAYVELCCEPAVGQVAAVDPDGTLRQLAFGQVPAITADGSRLAISDQALGVRVVDPVTGDDLADLGRAGDGLGLPQEGVVTRLAWSPDGTVLAAMLVSYAPGGISGTEVVVHRAGEEGWERPGAERCVGCAFPAFLADGRLVVGTGTRRGGDVVVASGLGIVDRATGAVEPRFGELELTSLDATPDGRWLVATSGPALRAFAGDDLRDAGTVGQLLSDVPTAAW